MRGSAGAAGKTDEALADFNKATASIQYGQALANRG